LPICPALELILNFSRWRGLSPAVTEWPVLAGRKPKASFQIILIFA
jgi:hypothetical protein